MFQLIYAEVSTVLPKICQLHRASTLPPNDQNTMVSFTATCCSSEICAEWSEKVPGVDQVVQEMLNGSEELHSWFHAIIMLC